MTNAAESVRRRLLVGALAIASACSSPGSEVGRLYSDLKADVAGEEPGPTKDAQRVRNQERAERVRGIVEKGEIKTSKERFQAAVLLVETEDPKHLWLAEQLAYQAAAEGEPLARRVAAEAIDKQLVLRRIPQRYGTQYEWVAAFGGWRLYPLDPTTTDEERRLVGVPPLAALYAEEKRLNSKDRAGR